MDLRQAWAAVYAEVVTQAAGTHADEIETSIMLHLAPEVVRMQRAVADVHPPRRPGPFSRSPDPEHGIYSQSGSYAGGEDMEPQTPRLVPPERGGHGILRDSRSALRFALRELEEGLVALRDETCFGHVFSAGDMHGGTSGVCGRRRTTMRPSPWLHLHVRVECPDQPHLMGQVMNHTQPPIRHRLDAFGAVILHPARAELGPVTASTGLAAAP